MSIATHFAMRRLAISVLAVTVLSGQTVLHDPQKIADAQGLLDTFRGDPLRCQVTPLKPHFLFSLRVQAGYLSHVPLTQSEVQGQKWIVLARITSKEGNGNPAYLSDIVQFPRGGDSNHQAEVRGSYWLGDGRYAVKFLMFDDGGETCRKEWQIDARLNSGVRGFSPILAPGTVADHSISELLRPAGAKPIGRLTILLHAASLLQLQTSLRDLDRAMLLDGMVALMEELPARSVRLVIFNLEQQKELSRRDNFTIDALPEVARELDTLQPSTVDYGVLQNSAGPADFLKNLANREIHASEPADAVVFLGPRSIYKDKPSPYSEPPAGTKPPFFYLLWDRPPIGSGLQFGQRYQGQVGSMGTGGGPFSGMTGPGGSVYDWPTKINYGPNNGPDSVQYTVDQLRGKTMKVDSVETFASSVAEIARLSGRAP